MTYGRFAMKRLKELRPTRREMVQIEFFDARKILAAIENLDPHERYVLSVTLMKSVNVPQIDNTRIRRGQLYEAVVSI
jgi:hypothetical protein